MKTLLDKVQTTEQEALDLIRRAEEQDKAELSNLVLKEKHILSDIQKKAEVKAQQIIQEKVNRAKSETGALIEEEKNAVSGIHAMAEKNHDIALAQAMKLFSHSFSSLEE